jgi:hypothetical protein
MKKIIGLILCEMTWNIELNSQWSQTIAVWPKYVDVFSRVWPIEKDMQMQF